MMVRRRAGGLDDVDVLAADVLLDLDERLAVGKWLDGAFSRLDSNGRADGLAQPLVGSAAKNLHNL